ncbi:MAG: biotin/lipoate A/B protein ligase family protein [Candidatus Bathyarchaeia archaeon]
MKTISWRLVNFEGTNPYYNIALEEAVAKIVGKGEASNTVRFWRNERAVVLGRFQSVEVEVDLNACIKHNVAIVRRFTGGGAVYHDLGNLNYSIIVNKGNISLGNIQKFFRKGCLSVIEALKILGLNPSFKEPSSILINEKKVSGAAGALRWNAIVYHSCILISANLSVLKEVLNCFKPEYNPSEKWVSNKKFDVNNLKNFMNKELSLEDVKEALKKGFEKVYEGKLYEDTLSLKELKLAEKLYKSKYCTHEWIYNGVEL